MVPSGLRGVCGLMGDDTLTDVPDLIPARMVNEYTWCPRFFHLAWVSKEFADNEYTVDGSWLHRTVEKERGELPDPSETAEFEARSVLLSSESLGLIGKADMVEGRGGTVVPVEFKRGKPKEGDERVWEPERVQLGVVGLLLREQGHRVSYGEVFFAETRTRVRVDLDEALTDRVMELVAEMRGVAADPIPPAPLVDSPKCVYCTLAGICLPDEQNLIRDRTARPPRRLLPTDTAARPMYVTEAGASLGRDGDRLVVRVRREETASVRLIDVSQVVVYGNVQISAQLMRELFARDVPVMWFTSGGWFCGMAEGLPAKNVELRRRQALAADGVVVDIARRMVEGKILNSRVLLRRNTRDRHDGAISELKRLAVRAARADTPAHLLALEGGAARIYFSQFASMLCHPLGQFDFERRNRRPPTDPVNCLLSFVYSLLTRDCTATLYGVGFDPYLGVFHRPRFGRPALGLDLAEEFRALIADSVVVTLVNNGEMSDRDFTGRHVGVSLTPDGRRRVLTAYERRMATEFTHPLFGYRITYRRALEVQARVLAAVLMGELEEYVPIVTR